MNRYISVLQAFHKKVYHEERKQLIYLFELELSYSCIPVSFSPPLMQTKVAILQQLFKQ
ncbi:hypothetical protein [Gracilibacillus boraciitolerans]|uniref:hypothetical protein n=1 Tax=Gracilibacillus boraciitolerans TaxID=307521 RepID=UPI001F26B74D|nr:hypothetical protein [Gracilibacillus boraciitolerans]